MSITHEEAIQAEQAEILLKSDVFKNAMENLKNEFLDRFCLIHLFSRENLGNAIQKGRIDEQKWKHEDDK